MQIVILLLFVALLGSVESYVTFQDDLKVLVKVHVMSFYERNLQKSVKIKIISTFLTNPTYKPSFASSKSCTKTEITLSNLGWEIWSLSFQPSARIRLRIQKLLVLKPPRILGFTRRAMFWQKKRIREASKIPEINMLREDICFQHYRPNQIDKIDDCM